MSSALVVGHDEVCANAEAVALPWLKPPSRLIGYEILVDLQRRLTAKCLMRTVFVEPTKVGRYLFPHLFAANWDDP